MLAYANGEIELEKVKALAGKGGRVDGIREAPYFTKRRGFIKEFNKPYNAESIAKFCGWLYPGGQVRGNVT